MEGHLSLSPDELNYLANSCAEQLKTYLDAKLEEIKKEIDLRRGAGEDLFVSKDTLMKKLDYTSPITIDRKVKAGKLPQPVELDGQPRWNYSAIVRQLMKSKDEVPA